MIGRLIKIVLIVFIFAAPAFAEPGIISLTMDPPDPGFGQTAEVTITYCGQSGSDSALAMAVSTDPFRRYPGRGRFL